MEPYTFLKALELLISKMEGSRANFDVIKSYLIKTPYFTQNIVCISISNFCYCYYIRYELADSVDYSTQPVMESAGVQIRRGQSVLLPWPIVLLWLSIDVCITIAILLILQC